MAILFLPNIEKVPKKKEMFSIAVLLSLFSAVYAAPNGAPICDATAASLTKEVTEQLVNAHGEGIPNTEYKLDINKVGEKFQIKVEGEKKFKGLLLYVLEDGERVGEFINVDGRPNFKLTENCGKSPAVTHSNDKEKSNPSFKWIAPEKSTGDFTVQAVVLNEDGWTLAQRDIKKVAGECELAPITENLPKEGESEKPYEPITKNLPKEAEPKKAY